MPSCLAYGCSNTSGRLGNVKKSFFRIPKPTNKAESLRAARWLHNIGTGRDIKKFAFRGYQVVCGDHFHPDCFERDLQAELLGYTPKAKKLLPGAVPTIFSYKIFDQVNMDGSTVSTTSSSEKRENKQETIQVCDGIFHISVNIS